MDSKLAIKGGGKVRETPFPAYKPLGEEEVKAVTEVVKSGVLSRFLGAWHEDFYGGPNVKAFESEWKEHFQHFRGATEGSDDSVCLDSIILTFKTPYRLVEAEAERRPKGGATQSCSMFLDSL